MVAGDASAPVSCGARQVSSGADSMTNFPRTVASHASAVSGVIATLVAATARDAGEAHAVEDRRAAVGEDDGGLANDMIIQRVDTTFFVHIS